MKRVTSNICLFYMLMCLFCSMVVYGAGVEANTGKTVFKTYTLAQLQEDFIQLQNILATEHPRPYTDKGAWDKLCNTQYKLLQDGMMDLDFCRIITPVVTTINCGHTTLIIPQRCINYLNKEGRYLPLEVRSVKGKVYVYHNLGNASVTNGSEITAINGRTISEIMAALLDNLASDGFNTTRKYCDINTNGRFNDLYATFVDNPREFVLSLQGPGERKVYTVTMPSVTKKQVDELIRQYTPPREENEGIYRQRFEKDYAVLRIGNFNFYDPGSQEPYKAFIDEFFKSLAERRISRLILDLRGNGGGDPYCTSYLFTYLIDRPHQYFSTDTPYYEELKKPMMPMKNNYTSRLYILINGWCFSSTGHFCSLLKFYKRGVFIGEETAGSLLCTAATQTTRLKNTGFALIYSTQNFKTEVSGLTYGRGIMPDYPVTPVMEDYWEGRDVEMEATLALMKKEM